MEFYKKIDKSALNYGVVIPNEHKEAFMHGKKLKPNESRIVNLYWKGKREKYEVQMIYRQKASRQKDFGLRWEYNKDFLLEIRKEFIQSYLAIQNQKYEAPKNGKYKRTKLQGGNQEVLILRSKGPTDIELETFVKVETKYDNIFQKLVEEDVFTWISISEKGYLIKKSSKWYGIEELKDHEDKLNVIYYLVDEVKKEIYIGSARKLGDRVKPGRKEIPEWSKFRYDMVHKDSLELLRRIEYQMIRAFATFSENSGKAPFPPISKYKLVNKNWPKRI